MQGFPLHRLNAYIPGVNKDPSLEGYNCCCCQNTRKKVCAGSYILFVGGLGVLAYGIWRARGHSVCCCGASTSCVNPNPNPNPVPPTPITGTDPLSFVFSIGTQLPGETVIGQVVTPTNVTFQTAVLNSTQIGSTNPNPLPLPSPIGTYVISLLPQTNGVNVNSSVQVFVSGTLATTLFFQTGPYTPQTQLTMTFEYNP